jgi:outer membrane protein TolC
VAYAAGPSFQWDLLNYGQIANNIRLQDAKLQRLLIDYQDTVLSAQQEVDNGLATYLQSRTQAAYLRRSVLVGATANVSARPHFGVSGARRRMADTRRRHLRDAGNG